MTDAPDVLVRVVFGHTPIVLWQRWEPAWHLAQPFDEYAGATEAVDDWEPGWRFRDGKTMRRAKFNHS